ncbi:replication protein [Escherichia coli]|uniref:replication protein n=1 Tax=Escherichia coli TaxID=562 RepID=UPI0006C48F5D|nr:replication protein [Escherichia coli]EIY1836629.1 replication protein [Escherichia coli]EKI4315024.1 replication protein [Escherichia coli]CTX59446.1 putative replication protein from phage (modular protein) [Escherichia coli]HAV9087699.1 replication protein [Escherichia coli]
MSRYAPTPEVMAIGQINISGNVTPANWWKYIRLPSGRPDATAIALLSEIVYWYRPTEVRDEHTGALLGYRKRFQGDKLQRSYQAFAEQFGFGKRETADALKRLRDAGFITLDLRTVEMLDGVKCSNILFVGINPQAIAAITTPSSVSPESNSNNAISDTAITLKRNTPRRHNGTGDTPNVDTNTEITTEITTETKNTIDASADASARSARQEYSPEFEQAWQEYPKRAGGNSKSAAFKAWKARIREGIKPETMLDGVKRYAAWVRATGNTGTQFVKQAATFFGPDRHFEDYWQQPAAHGGGRQRQVDVLAGLGAMSDKFGKSSNEGATYMLGRQSLPQHIF